jgi:hypothetical protein
MWARLIQSTSTHPVCLSDSDSKPHNNICINVTLRRFRVTIVAVIVKYSECVFVALVIQHSKRVHHIVICGLPRSTIFFPHYLINGKIFGKTLLNMKCVFWFFLQFCLNISHPKKTSARYCHKCTYIGLHKKYPLFLYDLNFLDSFSKKYSNVKFHENPSGGSRVVPRGETDVTKLILAFHSIAKIA